MAAATDEVALEIRKLRKKLRQIENLERSNRNLSEEEEAKVAKKTDIRERLLGFLAERAEEAPDYQGDTTLESEPHSSFTYTPANLSPVRDYGDTSFTGQTNEEEVQMPSSDEIVKASPTTSAAKRKVLSSETVEAKREEPNILPESKKAKTDTKKRPVTPFDAERKCWRLAEFQVDLLEGHSDLVTSVDTDGNTVVSSSRDTTVKVWDVKSGQEKRNLGGHTNTVTSVQLLSTQHSQELSEVLEDVLPEDQLVISGSLDCSLRIWSVRTGKTIRRIYTFDPITKLQYVPELRLIFTGSDGGKISMWDMGSGEATHSVRAHQEAITGLKFCTSYLYTASEDGVVKVHEVREQSLSCVFVSENVHKADGSHLSLRTIRDIEVRDNKVFYGDDRENLKVLDWKTGTVSKLRNNLSEFGFTDAVCAEADILLTSAYDLDNGLAFLNVRSLAQQGEYLATLSDDDTGRILCLAGHQGANHHLMIVSGGVEVKTWTMTPRKGMEEDLVPTRYLTRLSRLAVDSDLDSDLDDVESGDETEGSVSSRQRTKRLSLGNLGPGGEPSGWTSWCSLI
ncbi:WD repeat-containing protein wdr-5.1-like [Liolophura sinensis]|uniref:WD repeat-containing protein wdr-5.1-like n=1 Tax=Liolophura sinensis TaxID=3198878 RepID=UPI003158FC7E